MNQLYKVLVDGKSCHGGSYDWSLPLGDQPGDWNSVDGDLALCRWGLHLTDDPAPWWQPGCTVYLAEAEGIVGSCDDSVNRKVVCRRVRLLRQATDAELAGLQIYTHGTHRVDHGQAVASGSASVEAWDSASVEAWDSASVEAWDNASVEAWDNASVEASGSVTVISWRGKPGVKIVNRAVWVERGDNSDAPVIHTAGGES